jgi:hypothetical protein
MQHPFCHSCSFSRRTVHDTLCLKRAPCSHAAGSATPKETPAADGQKPRRGFRPYSAALLEAVAVGDLTPAEASELGKLIEAYIKALGATDFAERLDKLERMTNR